MAPTLWARFEEAGAARFGCVERHAAGDRIRVCEGDLFGRPVPTDRTLALDSVQLLSPVQPTKVIALWNNFHALARKLNLADPQEPLYLLKSPNAWCGPRDVIRAPSPSAYAGKTVFEGELGIVIGKTCAAADEASALKYVAGYTCANDVTAAEILNRDASFAQWVRAKGFDTFCPMGPFLATGLDPRELTVTTRLNGEVRQDYPISDMRFSVERLVSSISRDMTLFPGDVILCGTSIGVGSMKPGSRVEVEISGIGTLANDFST
jgi:2-keto-4-pentenoate hydratase/2-oxohepta-3-ene-1,7-dioic acid hydratase in catechol pathway